MATTVLLIYSHKDKSWRDLLVQHLAVAHSTTSIGELDLQRFSAERDSFRSVQASLAEARIVVLLVSADFLASPLIRNDEASVRTLLERRGTEGLPILPVLVRACAWQHVGWLARMAVRPRDGQPLLGRRHKIDKELAAIAGEILNLVSQGERKELPAKAVPEPNESTSRRATMPSVFISHCHVDRPFARRLAEDLRKIGVRVWIDEAEILVGDSLLEKIQTAIDQMEYFAVVLSPAAVASDWVRQELEIALNEEIHSRRVKLLPLLYQACEIPPFLRGRAHADFSTESRYQEEFSRLVKRFRLSGNSDQRLRGPQAREAPPPPNSGLEPDPEPEQAREGEFDYFISLDLGSDSIAACFRHRDGQQQVLINLQAMADQFFPRHIGEVPIDLLREEDGSPSPRLRARFALREGQQPSLCRRTTQAFCSTTESAIPSFASFSQRTMSRPLSSQIRSFFFRPPSVPWFPGSETPKGEGSATNRRNSLSI